MHVYNHNYITDKHKQNHTITNQIAAAMMKHTTTQTEQSERRITIATVRNEIDICKEGFVKLQRQILRLEQFIKSIDVAENDGTVAEADAAATSGGVQSDPIAKGLAVKGTVEPKPNGAGMSVGAGAGAAGAIEDDNGTGDDSDGDLFVSQPLTHAI